MSYGIKRLPLKFIHLIQIFISISALLIAQPIASGDDHLLVGAAEKEITPPQGIEIHAARPNVGIRDSLFLRALVLKDSTGTSIAIITK